MLLQEPKTYLHVGTDAYPRTCHCQGLDPILLHTSASAPGYLISVPLFLTHGQVNQIVSSLHKCETKRMPILTGKVWELVSQR